MSIATTAANDDMGWLHDRMPVILEAEDWPVWLGGEAGEPAELLRPCRARHRAALACQPGGRQRARQRAGLAGADGRSGAGERGGGSGRLEPGLVNRRQSTIALHRTETRKIRMEHIVAIIRGICLALALVIATGTYARASIAGYYLVTFHEQHPSNSFQEPLCVRIVQDGSTLGFKLSGTLVLDFNPSNRPAGQWFATGSGTATFTVPLDQDSASFLTFSGEFGKPQITKTTFALFSNGAAAAGGSFTAARGACSFQHAP